MPLEDGALTLDLAGSARWAALGGARRAGRAQPRRAQPVARRRLCARRRRGRALVQLAARPVLLDLGLVSSVSCRRRAPCGRGDPALTGTGLSAHLSVPLATWGTPVNTRQLGIFVGGSTSFLIELRTPSAARADSMMMVGRTPGFSTAEAASRSTSARSGSPRRRSRSRPTGARSPAGPSAWATCRAGPAARRGRPPRELPLRLLTTRAARGAVSFR